MSNRVEELYQFRSSRAWQQRLLRLLAPPAPFLMDPEELNIDAPLGRWNLYIGGAGSHVDGYVNLDLFPLPGVDVVANAEALPFRDHTFSRVECDAVLEHVADPEAVMREMTRTTAHGGFLHLVTPFCHPFHEYPKDFRRFTIDGLRQLGKDLELVKAGWRTGPSATLIVFVLEYVKTFLPNRPARAIAHGVLGWVLFPLRYMDLLLKKSARYGQIGNHCYVWLRKPLA